MKKILRDEGKIYSLKETWEAQNPVTTFGPNKLFKKRKRKK